MDGASYLLTMREICRDAPEKAKKISEGAGVRQSPPNNRWTDPRRLLWRQVGDEANSIRESMSNYLPPMPSRPECGATEPRRERQQEAASLKQSRTCSSAIYCC